MPSNLIQASIFNTLSAASEFGWNPELLVATPGRGITPWFTVPEGYYALVTRHGAEINDPVTNSCVWNAGFHFGWPWYKVSHLVRKGYTVFETPCKGCKSLDNVTIQIDISCVFRIKGDVLKGEDPNLVRTFVHQVTPRGLQQQLTDAIDEACRMLARSMKHREVYGLRSVCVGSGVVNMDTSLLEDSPDTPMHTDIGVDANEESLLLVGGSDSNDAASAAKARYKGKGATDRIVRLLNRQFEPQGVEVTDVMITDVKLPTEITQQMYNKTLVISSNAHEIMTQQFEMQDLKFTEEIKLLAQSFEEDRLRVKQEGEQRRNEVQMVINSIHAQCEKKIELMRQESDVVLQSIEAEADLVETTLVQERNAIVSNLKSKSEANAAQIMAETDMYCVEKLSDGDLEVQRNDAQAMEIVANAEGEIAPLLRQFNTHQTNLRKLEVFASLSRNSSMVIAPSGNSDVQTMLLCDEILSAHHKRGGDAGVSRSDLLSELMLMRTGGQVALNTQTGAAVLATAGGR